jgi:ribonuclease D
VEQFSVEFDKIKVVTRNSDQDPIRSDIFSGSVVGFDVEANPFPDKRRTTQGPHVVQLATDNYVYIFQLDLVPHALLKEVFSSNSLVKVGHSTRHDVSLLRRKMNCDFENFVDIAQALKDENNNELSLINCVKRVLGTELRKRRAITLSNWALRNLSDDQLVYASNDALAVLRIYQARNGEFKKQSNRKGCRLIEFDGKSFDYRIGKNATIIWINKQKNIVSNSSLAGIDPLAFDKGQWKGNNDGEIKPSHIRAWIEEKLLCPS